MLAGCCNQHLPQQVIIPIDKIVPIEWPTRDNEVTNEQMMDDIRALHREVIRDNERKRQLKEELELVNERNRRPQRTGDAQ